MEMQTIVRNNTDAKVEEMKLKLNLSGDVYIYNNHFMESLESHKKLFPESSATTIEQAYLESIIKPFIELIMFAFIVYVSKDARVS